MAAALPNRGRAVSASASASASVSASGVAEGESHAQGLVAQLFAQETTEFEIDEVVMRADARAAAIFGLLLDNEWRTIEALATSVSNEERSATTGSQGLSHGCAGGRNAHVLSHGALTLLRFIKAVMTMEDEDIEACRSGAEVCPLDLCGVASCPKGLMCVQCSSERLQGFQLC